jgi:hypothetical protein
MFITPADLEPFATIPEAKATQMIEDAEAMAVLTAPCIPDLTVAPEGETPAEAATRQAKLAAVKAILRGAILRWDEAGQGGTASHQKTAGPFGEMQTFTSNRRSMFWPSEIEQLQKVCSDGSKGKAYSVNTIPGDRFAPYHTPWCSYHFGAQYCSCGVDLTGTFPLFEVIETDDDLV